MKHQVLKTHSELFSTPTALPAGLHLGRLLAPVDAKWQTLVPSLVAPLALGQLVHLPQPCPAGMAVDAPHCQVWPWWSFLHSWPLMMPITSLQPNKNTTNKQVTSQNCSCMEPIQSLAASGGSSTSYSGGTTNNQKQINTIKTMQYSTRCCPGCWWPSWQLGSASSSLQLVASWPALHS